MLGVFGDVGFTTTARTSSVPGARLGGLDLYATAPIGARLTTLVEFGIEPGIDTTVDLERLWLGYNFSDLLTIRAGRQHSALGYWNKTFHHGRHLFLSIDRPFFLEFEDLGGVLPVHAIGLELEGRWHLGPLAWRYELQASNGTRIAPDVRLLHPNLTGNKDNKPQVTLRVSASPRAWPDVSVGLSGTSIEVDLSDGRDLFQTIVGADLNFSGAGFQVLAEYFLFASATARSHAFYGQLARSLGDDVTLFGRFEALLPSAGDPYLGALAGGYERRRSLGGIRVELDPLHSAIKAQYTLDQARGAPTFHVGELQWTFGL